MPPWRSSPTLPTAATLPVPAWSSCNNEQWFAIDGPHGLSGAWQPSARSVLEIHPKWWATNSHPKSRLACGTQMGWGASLKIHSASWLPLSPRQGNERRFLGPPRQPNTNVWTPRRGSCSLGATFLLSSLPFSPPISACVSSPLPLFFPLPLLPSHSHHWPSCPKIFFPIFFSFHKLT